MSQTPDPMPRPLDHLAECGEDDAPALVMRGETLSYHALRTRVAALASWLRAQLPDRDEDGGARIASWASKGALTCLLPLSIRCLSALKRLTYWPTAEQGSSSAQLRG